MANAWKTVRVYISSTFRDMHAERDHLVKVVFPALREEMEQHRIHLVDIDLRWGVTKEQADNDEALDVCLSEIDNCRPFFLGILGDRYGYVPTILSERLASKYGWIRHAVGKSTVELEIRHGVLNNPFGHGQSLFLVRDSSFLADVPEELRRTFVEEDPVLAAKLAELKQAIHSFGARVVSYSCRYVGVAKSGDVRLGGLDEFGRQVTEWLRHAIRAELSLTDSSIETTEIDPIAAESDFHERFMESRLRVFVGRDDLKKELMAFADGDEAVPCLVTGASGSGKSAALARFVADYRNARVDVLVIPHFVGASPASTSPRQMLRYLCLIIKRYFGFAEDVPSDADGLAALFEGFLTHIPPERRIVLVVDAFNLLDGAENSDSLSWLPRTLPYHVKVIASCIDDGDSSEPVLRAFANRNCRRVPLRPLNDDERLQIIRVVPALSAKALDKRQIALILSNPSTRNPLFLLVALEELRGLGSWEYLNARIDAFPRDGDTVTAIFVQVIGRLEQELDSRVSKMVLALLACAKDGLSELELQQLLNRSLPSIDEQQCRGEMHLVLRRVRDYLMYKGPMLVFCNRSFWAAVGQTCLATDSARREAHGCLAHFYASKGSRVSMATSSLSNGCRITLVKRTTPTRG